jgi:membrane protein implicated in regulation of membrane protease activity
MPDITQYLWIIWIVFALVCIIIELLTLEFTFLMIAAGSLLGGLGVNVAGGPWWLQIGLAAVISALLLFTIRPLLLKTLRRGGDERGSRTNVDALTGMAARATVDFQGPDGFVRLANGETWTARLHPAHHSITLTAGDSVVVTRIDGATAEVAPEERSALA